MKTKQYTITKKIAKHGNQAIIVVPKILESQLKPGIIAQITIELLNSQEK
jgi:antitoxin component of MazEF toxin-antitoxin module